MYTLFDRDTVIADDPRRNAYRRALEQAITPRSCVLEIGVGGGFLASLVTQLGARRVFVIRPDDVIGPARHLVCDSEFGDRITCIREKALEATLEERADVIVCDTGGYLPWHNTHLPVMNYARNRFLAPDGLMIPMVDRISAAVVSSQNGAKRNGWQHSCHDVALYANEQSAAREVQIHQFEPNDLLSNVVPVANLDYRASLETDLHQQIEFDIIRHGSACGVALWFDRELIESIFYENSPAAIVSQNAPRVHDQFLFPWPKDVDVTRGDSVRVSLRATLSNIGHYDWCWDSLIRRIAGGNIQGIRFSQSTASQAKWAPIRRQ